MDNLGIQVLKDTGNISGEEMRGGWVGGDTWPCMALNRVGFDLQDYRNHFSD